MEEKDPLEDMRRANVEVRRRFNLIEWLKGLYRSFVLSHSDLDEMVPVEVYRKHEDPVIHVQSVMQEAIKRHLPEDDPDRRIVLQAVVRRCLVLAGFEGHPGVINLDPAAKPRKKRPFVKPVFGEVEE